MSDAPTVFAREVRQHLSSAVEKVVAGRYDGPYHTRLSSSRGHSMSETPDIHEWDRLRYSRWTVCAAFLAGCGIGTTLTMVLYLFLDSLK